MTELKIRIDSNGDYIFEGDDHIIAQVPDGTDLSLVDLSDYNANLDVLYRLFDKANVVENGTSVDYETIYTQDGEENGTKIETDYIKQYAAMKQKVIDRNELAKQKLNQ